MIMQRNNSNIDQNADDNNYNDDNMMKDIDDINKDNRNE